MGNGKCVLIIGLDPNLIDFKSPEYSAFPDLTPEKVIKGLHADRDYLTTLGYEVEIALTDFGDSAEATVTTALAKRKYACVLVGAGVRTVPKHFLLFERLINLIHASAPGAKICFNTNPEDTAAAVQRWL